MSLTPGDLGVRIFPGPRVKVMCADCPFKREAEGRGYLDPDRIEGIVFAVTMGQPFHCHKTVYRKDTSWTEPDEDGHEEPLWDRKRRMCAGAIEAAEKVAAVRGIDPYAELGRPRE